MLLQKKCAAFVQLTVIVLGLLTFAACKKDAKLSTLAGFLEFKIKDVNVTFTIDETAQKIQNTDSLPFGTDVTALVAEFITVPNATVKIGNTPQISGTTVNNFSQPLTYSVVAEDGVTTRQYTVQVNVEKVDPKSVAWQRLTADAGHSFHNTRTVFFNNKFWTLGATIGSASITCGTWSSPDGINWTREEAVDNNGDSIPRVESGALVTFQNKMWLIGGIRPGEPLPEGGSTFSAVVNKVWYTSDGVNWTVSEPNDPSERWSIRERANVVVFNNKLWLIGGNGYPFGGNTNAFGTAYRDIWSSTDGINWTQETATPAFPARTQPAVFVHDNKIWLVGGRAGATYLSDVWTSTDGVNWTEVTVNTPFTGRLGHKIVAYDDQLFLVGGENADGVLGDCWISEDNGVNWTQLQAGDVRALPGAFAPRVFHSMFVHDNAIWIAGGLSTKNASNVYTQLSDLWKGKLVK